MPQILAVIVLFLNSTSLLGQQSEDIETIVVTASRTPVSINDSGSSISVITRADLERWQSIQIADVIRNVPGVAVSRSGPLGAQTQLRLRGAEANHVLVLIDGVEVNDPAFGDEFQFEHLTTDQIERVEIVRGPQSALWGSDAVAGVINVITRRNRSASGISGFLESGSFATQHAGGRMWVAGDGYDVGLDAGYLEADGTNVSREGVENDGYKNTTVNLTGSLMASERLDLEFFARHTDFVKQFDAIDTITTGRPIDADRLSNAAQSYFSTNASLSGTRLQQQLKLTYLDTLQNSVSDGTEVSAFGGGKLALYYQANLPLAGSDSQHLTLALDHERADFSQQGAATPFGDPNQEQRLQTTGYVFEYRVAPNTALDLSLSARYDNSSDFDSVTTFRFTGSYALERTRLRGSVGTGHKSPTFVERFGFFPDTFVGNPQLKPEHSRGWEIGVERPLTERLSVSTTYFNEQLEDEIDGFVFDPARAGFTAANVADRSKREGVEFSVLAQPSQSLDLSASYTYTDSTQPDDTGKQIAELRRPKHLASLNLNYAVGHANINLNVTYNGTRYDLFFPPFPQPSERRQLASYRLVNLAASYSISPRVSLFGRIENLLDEDYEDVFGFNTPGIGTFIGVRAQL